MNETRKAVIAFVADIEEKLPLLSSDVDIGFLTCPRLTKDNLILNLGEKLPPRVGSVTWEREKRSKKLTLQGEIHANHR